MAKLATSMDILKLLDESNCRKCGKPTCMAFAVAVINGQKQLGDCPKLEDQRLEPRGPQTAGPMPAEGGIDESIESLLQESAKTDLAAAAERLGAVFSDGRLTLKCLGRDFSVDNQGHVTTDLHLHGWLMMPALDYILHGAGRPASGRWVRFRELSGVQARYPLFEQRCEKPCKRLADADVELFEDIISLFGKPVENQFGSDISVVLYPLPRLPVLIRYWKPEEGLESNLSFLFDSSASENLGTEFLYVLGTGLILMFEKIALAHGLPHAGL